MNKYDWLELLRKSNSPKLRLFCFPYAGGSAAIYKPWINFLPSEIELIAISLPGRSERLNEAPISDINEIIEGILEDIQNLQDVPFSFFGHSMGARIAYGLTLKMQAQHCNLPEHLILSASCAPDVNKERKALHTLPDNELIAELKRMKGTPIEILENDELMNFLLPMIRADFNVAHQEICADEMLRCTVNIIGGTEDLDIEYAGLEAWGNRIEKPFDINLIEGDHFFINAKMEGLLSIIKSILVP